jgi:RimJ/RimL family protein N-acetyltransferase
MSPIKSSSDAKVSLRAWTSADLGVLQRNDTADMTAYLGGPEGPEKLLERHERFLRQQTEGIAWPFTVWVETEPEAVGSVLYWYSEHHGQAVYECGWAIATPYQGKGYATRSIRLALEHAAANGDRDRMYAFPRVDNAASNAIARAAGFSFVGVEDFEYPKGVPIKVHTWLFDLRALR